MPITQPSTSDRSFGGVAVVALGLGALLTVYGLVFLSASLLGGLHIAAIGLSVLLAGLVTTEWAGNRWDLSPTTRNGLSWGFLAVGAVLLVAFLLVDFVSFGGPFVESISDSGR